MGDIAKKAAELAMGEWKDRWKKGAGDEDDPAFRRFVAEYWDALGAGFNNWENTENPWSAAFISYVFRKAGAKSTQFPFAAGHHVYIRKGDDNFRAEKFDADLVAYTVDERRPEVGDLVIQWRDKPQRLRHLPASGFTSHTDIVVQVTPTRIETIGGNVGDSVKMRPLRLDGDGHIILTPSIMGLLKVNF
jgi:hypothetical protein